MHCSEIRGCPASQYMKCRAYRENAMCWEIEDPRCTNDFLLCIQHKCPVYEDNKIPFEDMMERKSSTGLR